MAHKEAGLCYDIIVHIITLNNLCMIEFSLDMDIYIV